MKTFQRVRRQYAILGIESSSNQSIQKLSFNGRVFFGFSLFPYVYISQVVYICHEASGLMEYMGCISSMSGTIIIFICYATIVFQKTTLFQSIDSIEKHLDMSKLFFLFLMWSRENESLWKLESLVELNEPMKKSIFIFEGQHAVN